MEIESNLKYIIAIIVVVAVVFILYQVTSTPSTQTQNEQKQTAPVETWQSVGCWMDKAARALSINPPVTNLADCQAYAKKNNYSVAAMQNGNQCFVGNGTSYQKYGKSTTCPANGGPWINDVYTLSN